jgi:uncharacterized membrane protein YozB (DUF420 family)
LAEKLGVSRQAISKWETGEATPERRHRKWGNMVMWFGIIVMMIGVVIAVMLRRYGRNHDRK